MAATEDAVRQDAMAQLQSGHRALAEGRIERAAEALVMAETLFRQLGDKPHTAESRAALAEVQRENGALEQASASYERAIDIYHEIDQPAKEAGILLQLGHIERQRGMLQQAWQHYYLSAQLFGKGGNTGGQANANLALGHIARLRGQTQRAEEAYSQAVKFAAEAQNTFGEADAARGLGDILTARGSYDEAANQYARALDIYRESNDRFGEVDTLISQGRLSLEAGKLDEAATRFGEAIAIAAPIEYLLGSADGVLGTAQVALREGRLDQALANATQAEATYTEASGPFGQAEANRVLGEVQLRRGQLAQAIALFDRSSRAYRAVQSRVPYAQAILGSAEAHRRAGTPRKAEDLFGEARTLGDEIEQPTLVASAVLGLGRIARTRGQTSEARTLLDDAVARYAVLHQPGQEAEATFEKARLALTTAALDTAAALLARGRELAGHTTHATERTRDEATAATIESALALTLGQNERARASAQDALRIIAMCDDETTRIEALLASAEATLAAANYGNAVTQFNTALDHARKGEAIVAEATAQVGLARVLLQRGLAAEAVAACAEVLPRLRATDEPAALISLYLTIGGARRMLEEYALARDAFAQAGKLASATGARLDEARALHGEGRVALDQENAALATERIDAARHLIEAVGGQIADESTRAGFYDTQAELWADAITAAAFAAKDDHANELARAYAKLASRQGRATAAQRLRDEEQALPTKGPDVSAQDAERNKTLSRALSSARSALGK